ncbi:unknown [synthetic Vaccinia virus]|nr:unknown [synthetic Vaccinia virus]
MDLARLGSMSSYDFSTVVSVLLVSIRSISRSIESKHDRSEDNEYL